MRKLQLDWQGYYPMDERAIRDKVQDDSGIFKISCEQKDGGLKPVYIGGAKSVRLKLLELATKGEDEVTAERIPGGKCSFKLAYLYTQDDMDAAVKALCRRYAPKCNNPDAVPETEDVEVNYN